MTGKEAMTIMSYIARIYEELSANRIADGMFELGRLQEKMEMICEIDKCSFNPTLPKENE